MMQIDRRATHAMSQSRHLVQPAADMTFFARIDGDVFPSRGPKRALGGYQRARRDQDIDVPSSSRDRERQACGGVSRAFDQHKRNLATLERVANFPGFPPQASRCRFSWYTRGLELVDYPRREAIQDTRLLDPHGQPREQTRMARSRQDDSPFCPTESWRVLRRSPQLK
jgi:hypothetical protein